MRSHCENASIFQGKVISHSGRVLYFRRSTKRKRLPEPNLCGRCGAAYLLDSSAGKSECLSPLEEKSFGHSVLNITLR